MIQLTGVTNWAARFLQDLSMKDAELWAKFVEVFRVQQDGNNQGWRGEFWGKMMRGASMIYAYTQDPELYEILTASVKDLMTAAEEDGRISSYTREAEFDSWDLWSRKYIMLASEYYLEICKDEALKKEILTFISRCADYIIDHIGEGEGKKDITAASRSWLGINSSSILEPIVRLYKLTGAQKYLDFATYIVNRGGASTINIFELAYENKLYPYQYGVSKAYEMISCFEGLLEYYEVTGIEKHKIAAINFGRAVLESELSIIGCCGITHELFDHTANRQTVVQDEVMQETCVTVTWMKYAARLLELTGDTAFADSMEQSFYNAYLGAFNTENKDCPYAEAKFLGKEKAPKLERTYLPMDSYSPLTPGKRGKKIGGSQQLHDYSYYGCCACISGAGVGIFLKEMISADEQGIIINFFEQGLAQVKVGKTNVYLQIETDYPTDGKIKITLKTDKPAAFTLKIRNPGWSNAPSGYSIFKKEWKEETIELDYEMHVRVHHPISWERDVVYTKMQTGDGWHRAIAEETLHKAEEDHYIALTYGPLTLAADSRMGKSADSLFDFEPIGKLCEDEEIIPGVPCLLKMKFTDKNGEEFYLVDYSSAGRDWETIIAAWLPTKGC